VLAAPGFFAGQPEAARENLPMQNYTHSSTGRQDSARECNDDTDVFGHVGHAPLLVPDSDYQIGFVRAERGHFENRQRIFLWFRIITPGEQFGIELYLVCPCPANGGKIFGLGSKLVAAATVALGQRPKRRDRLSTRTFAGKVFLARTRTVTRDHKGKERPREDHYSVLDELLRVEAGSSCPTTLPKMRAATPISQKLRTNPPLRKEPSA
jgi:hypothetical protein